jgi:hypothetical protein
VALPITRFIEGVGVLIEKVRNMPKRPKQTDDDNCEQKAALWFQVILRKAALALVVQLIGVGNFGNESLSGIDARDAPHALEARGLLGQRI